MLEPVAQMDAEGLFRYQVAEKDARKVCGLPPIYAMLQCMRAEYGELIKYDYHLEPATESMVSFCAMAFYK